MMRRLLLIFLLMGFALTARAEVELSFGIVPQQSATRLAQLWLPLLKKLEQDSGVRLRFRTAPDIPTFEKRLHEGEYDVAYMNPYHYTVFSRSPGYRAIARERDKKIQGIVVVKKDSPLTQVEALDGQRLAYPAPAAFAASVLPQASFERMGMSTGADYVGSHDSVYRAVAKGIYPAGGGVARTFNNVEAEVREQLRVLWRTDTYTPHAIAVHPRVSAEQAQRLGAALQALEQSEEGRALLKALRFKGMTTAEDGDWDDVRALDIRLLEGLLD